jgi:hypothetical protein
MSQRRQKEDKIFKKESQMYPEVMEWLERILLSRYPRSQVHVHNTSQVSLWKFLRENDYARYFKDYQTYEIQVDITGIVLKKKTAVLSFIECKTKSITLKDISQLLGYSRVASPHYSLLISIRGISKSVSCLLRTFSRYDILEYAKNKRIKIANWDLSRKEIDIRSILPPGEHL